MAAKLTALQFFFAITWVVYVVYLPALAEQAGIDKRHVPAILMLDQAIFIACDWAAGIWADRLASLFGRVGGWMVGASFLSCAAFLAMPFAAPVAGSALFLALVVVWSVTSSALRAPPLVIASRYSQMDERPWLASVYLLGLGLASAIAPYLGLALKGVDPRAPFAAASIGVAIFALVAARAEGGSEPRAPHMPQGAAPLSTRGVIALAGAILVFAIGLQVHVFVNSPSGYLRFAPRESLPELAPVFWIGFSLAVLPASLAARAFGGPRTIALAGAIGAAALFGCAQATSLAVLVAGQLIAGAAWAVALASAVAAAMGALQGARTGFATGLLFSVLAGAALARLLLVSGGSPEGAAMAQIPAYAWAFASVIAAVLAILARGPGVRPA